MRRTLLPKEFKAGLSFLMVLDRKRIDNETWLKEDIFGRKAKSLPKPGLLCLFDHFFLPQVAGRRLISFMALIRSNYTSKDTKFPDQRAELFEQPWMKITRSTLTLSRSSRPLEWS